MLLPNNYYMIIAMMYMYLPSFNQQETERAVLAYIIHLQQLAMNLQKRLRETNFNTTAWKKVQDSLRQHVQLTQSLIRLPSPAQNRLEPQRVDVIATSIPVAIVRPVLRR